MIYSAVVPIALRVAMVSGLFNLPEGSPSVNHAYRGLPDLSLKGVHEYHSLQVLRESQTSSSGSSRECLGFISEEAQ